MSFQTTAPGSFGITWRTTRSRDSVRSRDFSVSAADDICREQDRGAVQIVACIFGDCALGAAPLPQSRAGASIVDRAGAGLPASLLALERDRWARFRLHTLAGDAVRRRSGRRVAIISDSSDVRLERTDPYR